MNKLLRIVLIDDSSSSNLYHNVMMEDAGINVEECVKEFTSSIKAKAYLNNLYENQTQDHFPDIILIDINMPEMNGWQIIEFLEELTLNGMVPAVYMVSNSRHPSDLEKAAKYDIVQDIIEKHLTVDFFKSLLEQFDKKPVK